MWDFDFACFSRLLLWTKQKSIIAKSRQNLYAVLVIEGDFGNGILSISNDFTQVLADFGVALIALHKFALGFYKKASKNLGAIYF